MKFGTALDRIRKILDLIPTPDRAALLVSLVMLYGVRDHLVREYERERRASHRALVRDTPTLLVPDSVPDTTVVSSTALDSDSEATTRKLPVDVPDKRGGETGEAITEYRRLFKELHGSEPIIKRPQDPVNLGRIVSQVGIDKTKALLAEFFKTDDAFVQNAGHGLGVFSSVVNKLMSVNGRPIKAPKKYSNDLWAGRAGGEVKI